MKNAILIEDLIKQLQEIAITNPGIKVLHFDQEYGISGFINKIEKVFHDTAVDNPTLITRDLEGHTQTLELIEYFTSTSTQQSWLLLDPEDQQEYYQNNFSTFANEQQEGLKYHLEEKVKYENADTYLVISGR